MEVETWKSVIGYEGLYEVSNLSRVRSLPRLVPTNGLTCKERMVGGGIMKQNLSQGYCNIRLCKEGKSRLFRVHRLLAQAFIPNTENKPHINHINSIRSDNRIENLEWVTNSENVAHMVSAGRNAYGEKNGQAITNEKEVALILLKRKETRKGAIGLQKYFPHLTADCIHNIISGRNWKYLKPIAKWVM